MISHFAAVILVSCWPGASQSVFNRILVTPFDCGQNAVHKCIFNKVLEVGSWTLKVCQNKLVSFTREHNPPAKLFVLLKKKMEWIYNAGTNTLSFLFVCFVEDRPSSPVQSCLKLHEFNFNTVKFMKHHSFYFIFFCQCAVSMLAFAHRFVWRMCWTWSRRHKFENGRSSLSPHGRRVHIFLICSILHTV